MILIVKIGMWHFVSFQSRKRLYNHQCPFVCPSVCQEAKPLKQLKIFFISPSSLPSPPPSSHFHHTFITALTITFITTFIVILHPLILRLLSFSACFLFLSKIVMNHIMNYSLKTYTLSDNVLQRKEKSNYYYSIKLMKAISA